MVVSEKAEEATKINVEGGIHRAEHIRHWRSKSEINCKLPCGKNKV